ncbi:MAG TPA: methyltransferase domain-containing protein [Longimicrobium sp.]|jgi:SAM-dependent methyltransferase|uniref:methyltransferase domain-containing protein n=1 Tax=Longimicrobium sp. TaxID=2029185 RepID=UPI002ED810E1
MYPELHDDLREHRDWLLSFVHLPPGGTVADLGCGNGGDLLALAHRHPDPAARFIGIDAAETGVATALERAADDPRISVRRHRLAGRVPLDDGSVDAVYSHNLLECIEDRAGFAREVGRILRPGGVAVIAHWDFDSQIIDGTDRAAIRRLVHAFADWRQPWMEHADGWMGRRLWGVFAPTGLFEGTVHARVLTNTRYAPPWYGHARVQDFGSLVKRGLASKDDVRRVTADLEALDAAGRYFYGITGYAYVGRRVAQTA